MSGYGKMLTFAENFGEGGLRLIIIQKEFCLYV